MTLDLVAEPMDHFTTEDDAFLHKLLNEKKKGTGYETVIIKDDMKDIAKDVMDHWYAVKGADFQDFMTKNFDKKWSVLDNRGKGQIEYDEGLKFIRDFIGGMIQL